MNKSGRPESFPATSRSVIPRLSLATRRGWRVGRQYLFFGLQVFRFTPWLYLWLAALFSLPSLAAAWMTLADLGPHFVRSAAVFILYSISATVAPPMVMMAVAAGYRSQSLGLAQSMARGLFWFPRYLWTNIHTSVIFWVPVGLVLELFQWQRQMWPLEGIGRSVAIGAWVLLIAGAGLYMHSRTLLAPFLAVHGHLPGTLAALESWRLSGRHFASVCGVLIVASAPVGVPMMLGMVAVLLALQDSPAAKAAYLAMLPSLSLVLIQFVRPLLIPAAYGLYVELWEAETLRRAVEGTPEPPRLARVLLGISWWLPRLAGRLAGRRLDLTL